MKITQFKSRITHLSIRSGLTFIWIVFMFGVCQQCTSSEDKKNEPNVLFIVSDDMRPDLGCYGFPVHSPNIDELANSGMRFTNAFCNVSVCGASRSSFMTGIRPTYDTYNYYNSYAEKDNPEALTLPEYFKQNGYYTIARNKVFGMPDDSDDSWDELWSPVDTIFYWRDYATRKNIILDSLRTKRYGSYPYECAEVSDTAYIDGKLVDMAIKDLRKLKKNKKKFFMAVGFRKPHLPFTAPKKYWDLYDREQFDFPENYVVNETNIPMNAFHNSDELRAYKGVPPSGPVSDSMAITMMHGYYACISYVDNLIGKLLGELHDLGLDENTIIVMIGDHGWNLGEHGMWCKHCNFNTSFHSLMTVNVPGINTRGVTNSITEFVDIFPTLCELCDLPELEQLEGESFVEVLKDPDYEVKDHAVARWREGITLINKEYFYTEWRDKNDEMYERMLFDHSVDPDENINIVNLKENSELVDSLHTKLMNSRGTSYYK